MDKVKVAFIGCGGNARGHMGRVAKLDNADLVAVCDTVEELAQKTAEQFESTAYTDLEQMLDTAKPDAVYISIPVFAHGAPEKAVIARGLPFLCEKPLARYMKDAREIERLVNESGVITAVGYQLRYSTTVDQAKAILADKVANLAVGTYWCGTGRMDPSRWTVQYAKSGGQILEQATHTIDMMRYLMGEVTEVHAYGAHMILDAIDCDDATAAHWKHASGALGSITTSWAMDNSDWRFANQVHICGDGFHLHWSAPKLQFKDGAADIVEFTDSGPNIDEVFVTAVQRNDPSAIRSSYSDGLKTMAISIAALTSVEQGRPVPVDQV